MPQLESLLDALIRGEAGYEELAAALDARLREARQNLPELTALLDGARARGLPHEVHQALLAAIERHATSTASGTTRGTTTAMHAGGPQAHEQAAGDSRVRSDPTATGSFPMSAAGEAAELGEGDHLRGRFELVSKLGEGGMGAVWKGKDLLKEEAKDRNPYVAIKLLQKNFKEHPDAFVALQRETAKQQRLAHPNVATVFSFDRDTESGSVFMSMDLLEGESLDAFIKGMPEGGLTEAEAMSIIEQLADGLAYAHKNGLVHSDLKPGNCFLTDDGTVKLLDFGIARASKTKADAEGVTTLFDPADLGAITPAYATIEMFEGEEPDPRDDIYALGIMAYQLLTGRHPYDKLSAPRAREQNLVPEPVAKLSKRQNRGLARALALDRERRTASVDQFIDDIQRKHNLRVYGIAASVVAVVLIAALAYARITDFVRDEENEAIISILERGNVENIAEGLAMIQALESDDQRRDVLEDPRTGNAVVEHIARGDRHSIREGLTLIRPFDNDWQQDIREDPRARDPIIDYYQQLIDAAFEPGAGRYDYATAKEHIDTLGALYPNSATVLTMGNTLEKQREDELDRLTRAYDRLLGDLRTPADSGDESIGDVLQAIRRLDPGHPALKDPRLADAFVKQTRAAISAGDLEDAQSIMALATELLPGDPSLAKLARQLDATFEHERQDRLAIEVRTRLETQRDSLNTLTDFRRMQSDLMLLASLRPHDTMLEDLRWQLKQIFVSEFDALIARQRWQEAEDLLVDFARFVEIPYVASQRARLSAAEQAHDYRPPASASRHSELARRAAIINKLLERPLLTPEWEAQFEPVFKESLAMVGTQGSGVELIQRTMMLLYQDRALEAIKAKQYVYARNLITKGRAYDAHAPELDEADRILVQAQQSVLVKQELAERDSRIDDLHAALLAHAAAGRPEEAALALQALMNEVPDGAPFITDSAAPAVAAAFLASAEKNRAAGDLEAAVRQLERAQAVSPTADIERALARYRSERTREELTVSLTRAMASRAVLDTGTLGARLSEHKQRYPGEHEALTAELIALATARLVSRTNGPSLDADRLRAELDAVQALFPEAADSIANDVATAMEQRAAALAATDAYAAHDYIAAALSVLPANRTLAELSRQLPPREIARARNDVEAGRLNAARAALVRARGRYPGHDDIARIERDLARRASQAERAYTRYVSGVKKRTLARASERRRAFAEVERLWSDNPAFRRVAYRAPRRGECSAELAGRGREGDGVCYDLLAGGDRGLPLVVVPVDGDAGRPYAMGKYETSIAEYNTFCASSGECRPLEARNPQLPVTGVTRQEAERYARWLSRQASASSGEPVVYRLPTGDEWRHAAAAGGARATRGINCRPSGKADIESGLLAARNGSVSLGMPLGRTLVSVTFGEENGWGMVNPVGNAQEWVVAADGLAASGGAYTDKASRCRVAFSRSHDGDADERTGFRLLRELN